MCLAPRTPLEDRERRRENERERRRENERERGGRMIEEEQTHTRHINQMLGRFHARHLNRTITLVLNHIQQMLQP